MSIINEKYLDLDGLKRFWDNSKQYIDNNYLSKSGGEVNGEVEFLYDEDFVKIDSAGFSIGSSGVKHALLGFNGYIDCVGIDCAGIHVRGAADCKTITSDTINVGSEIKINDGDINLGTGKLHLGSNSEIKIDNGKGIVKVLDRTGLHGNLHGNAETATLAKDSEKLEGWSKTDLQCIPQTNLYTLIDSNPLLINDIALGDKCTVVTAPDNDAPFGKVWLCNGRTLWSSPSNKPIYVTPGDTICVESWIMRPEGAEGTDGYYYLGLQFRDKNGIVVNNNGGVIYMPNHSSYKCSCDGKWYRRYGEYTVPKTHTPYTNASGTLTSDGGAFFTCNVRVVLNDSQGTIPTYFGGFRVSKKIPGKLLDLNGIKTYESLLQWGNTNISNGVSIIDSCTLPELCYNRLSFVPGNLIDVEFSRDGGANWYTYPYSITDVENEIPEDYEVINDSQKTQLVTDNHYHALHLGARKKVQTPDDKLRVTITADGISIYFQLKKILIYYCQAHGKGNYCLVEAAYANDPETFLELGNYPVSGWTNWNSIPCICVFGEYSNSSRASNVRRLRLTFGITEVTSTTATDIYINKLRMIGCTNFAGNVKNLAKNGHIYSYDINQNVTFPANLTSTGNLTVNGNTTLGNAVSDTITIKGKTTIKEKTTIDVGAGLVLKGNSAQNPLITRSVKGSDGNGNLGPLYIQYGVNQPIYLGNNGNYTISADGSQYSGNAATATKFGGLSTFSYALPDNGGRDSYILIAKMSDWVPGTTSHYCLIGTIYGMRDGNRSNTGVFNIVAQAVSHANATTNSTALKVSTLNNPDYNHQGNVGVTPCIVEYTDGNNETYKYLALRKKSSATTIHFVGITQSLLNQSDWIVLNTESGQSLPINMTIIADTDYEKLYPITTNTYWDGSKSRTLLHTGNYEEYVQEATTTEIEDLFK